MPDVKGLDYLVQWITEIGLYKQAGFGITPIDWQDIKAWAELTETSLTSTEALALMSASRNYCHEYSMGSDPQRESPDDDRGYGYSPEVVSANVDANIRNIIKDQNKAAK